VLVTGSGCKQGRQANKVGGLTRQVGQVNVCAALAASIVSAATNKTSRYNKTGSVNIREVSMT
jgi:hypothetical protein